MTPLMFEGFFQFGYVCRDLRRATEAMAERCGVTRFRFKSSPGMNQAHAYIGATMIELIQPAPGASAIYHTHVPEDADAIRLHHLGYRIESEDSWERINRAIDRRGIATDVRGAVMDGHLRYLYADTLAHLGHYSEYVFLTGPARALYDDVPRNG